MKDLYGKGVFYITPGPMRLVGIDIDAACRRDFLQWTARDGK